MVTIMKTYALVTDSMVHELIEPAIYQDGTEIAIADRFSAEVVALLVDVTELAEKPQPRWTYDPNDATPFKAFEV